MNQTSFDRVLKAVHACWPSWKPTADDTPTWRDMLGALDEAPVMKAITEFSTEDAREFAPPPGLLRHRAIEIGKRPRPDDEVPRVCQLCDGSTWVDAPPETLVVKGTPIPFPTVTRCRCYVVRKDHPGGCTCSRCHYGPDRGVRPRPERSEPKPLIDQPSLLGAP